MIDRIKLLLETCPDPDALRALLVAAVAAWDVHYEGGFPYTDDPALVALFDETREGYCTWRDERAARHNAVLRESRVWAALQAGPGMETTEGA
jgi:hypothetical protein